MASVPWVKKNSALPLQDRRRRKRYTISSLAWGWLLCSLLTSLLVSLLLVINQARTEQQLLYESIDKALNQAVGTYSDRRAQLKFLADLLTNSAVLVDLARKQDHKGLNSFFESVKQLDPSYFIAVWNKQKQILAQSGTDGIPLPEAQLSQVLDHALMGQETTTLVLDSSGHARQILVRPYYDNDSGGISGVLSLGFFLEDGFLNRISSIDPNQQVIVLSDNQVVFAQLDDPQGVPLLGHAAPQDFANLKDSSKATAFFPLNTTRGTYEFKFVPISSPSIPDGIMLGLGVPDTFLSDIAGNLLNPLVLAPFAVAIGLSIMGFIYLRGFHSSLHELRSATRRMLAGDLKTRISLERPDEIGDIAGELDRVRKQGLIELERAHSQQEDYARVLNSMGIAAMQTDASERIVWVNPAAEFLLKKNRTELLGKPWHFLLVEKDAATESPWFSPSATMAADPIVSASSQMMRYSGILANSSMKVYVISSPITVENGITGFVHVLLDRTEEENFLRSKEEFMMYAGHELRTPVAKLMAAIEFLNEAFRERNVEQERALLGNIQRTIVQFQLFVENLIDSSSVQSGRFRLRPTKTEFKGIIIPILEQFQPFTHSQSQDIKLHMDLPSPCLVMADSMRLKQVMFNLLTNASKYGGEGNPIDVTVVVRDGYVVTEVTDHGPGIDPAEQELIFQRFYRSKRVELEGMGIGLGLALARIIVEQHGGEIHVKSEKSHGTTFWFRIPLAS